MPQSREEQRNPCGLAAWPGSVGSAGFGVPDCSHTQACPAGREAHGHKGAALPLGHA